MNLAGGDFCFAFGALHRRSGEFGVSLGELSHCLVGTGAGGISKVVAVLGLKVAGLLISPVARDDTTEAGLSALNWTIDKREFCNVVFVDHAQNWLLLCVVVLRVLMLLLVCSLEFSEAIVGHESEGFLLGLAIECA